MMNEDLTNSLPIPTDMPTPTGMMTLWNGPREIWSGKFPIRFSALNAAVRWHFLQFSMLEVQCSTIAETVGLISYSIKLNGVGILGEVCIRELPDERFTALIITTSRPSGPVGWTVEEEEVIKSEPDRISRLKVMHELATTQADEREVFTRWQEFVFNIFLRQMLSDTEVIEALKVSLDHRNVSLHLGQIFKGYDRISEIVIEKEDMAALHKLYDSEIRHHLAKLILNADPALLQREARKPHGSFEISDMEIPIQLEGIEFHLCIPVKSARDNGIKNRDSVPVEIAYQIFRPFLHLNRCAVVFVSSKRCSQNLMNFIKKMKNNLGWTIEVIEDKELAQLFKLNGLL